MAIARPNNGFKPGKSGNPNGRAPSELTRAAVRALGPQALARLAEILADNTVSNKDQLQAIKLVFDFSITRPGLERNDTQDEALTRIADALAGDK